VAISLNLLKTSTFRLAAVYLFVFALSVAAILGYVYWNTAVLLERQIDNSIRSEIATIANEYQQTGLPGLLEAMDRRSELESNHVYLFTNPLGRRLAGNLNALPVAATGRSGWIDFSYAVETAQGLDRIVRPGPTTANWRTATVSSSVATSTSCASSAGSFAPAFCGPSPSPLFSASRAGC
jgi:hypothetical protein